jgi:hypothetical protein
MARREEGEYSTYSTDEQRRQRAKDQARWLQNAPVEAPEHLVLHANGWLGQAPKQKAEVSADDRFSRP